MSGLKPWESLEPGGVVRPDPAERPRTGGWRTGVRPQVELDACVNCLLCWVYCPDSAVNTSDGAFAGFDLDRLQGLRDLRDRLPTGAIEMVPEHAA